MRVPRSAPAEAPPPHREDSPGLAPSKLPSKRISIAPGPTETIVVDPVCRMQVRLEAAPARLPFQGRTYYFCSFACAKAFAERPDLYSPD